MRTIYFLFFISTISLISASCKPLKLSEADRRFKNGEYFEAASMYRKLYQKTKRDQRDQRGIIAFRMAESYRLYNNVVRANPAYANAIRYNSTDTLNHIQYARALQKAGEYKKAAEQYEFFLKQYPDNQFALNALKGCLEAPEMKANPTLYNVKRMDIFNSSKSEFSPTLLPPDYDMIYITTSRDGVSGDSKSTITGLKNNDIFVSRKDDQGNWTKPESAGKINTDFDEGVPSFSISGNVMFYTFSPQYDGSPSTARIYRSARSGSEWGQGSPVKFLSNDTITLFAHPSISPSGDFLYFVSDMKGGYGGKDIWRAGLLGDEISFVENLGPEINSAGDEMFPFVRNDSTLYFASDGHVGMGGLDLFKAVYDKKKKKWNVENMGYPINSSADDFGITFEGINEKGFFSSNRNDARGYDHIYSFEYPNSMAKLEGYIVDKDDEFVPFATIRVVGNDGTNQKFRGTEQGTYKMDLSKNVDYVMLASADGYLNTKRDLKTANIETDSLYYVDFIMYSITKPTVLENIFYDFDKATLRSESKKELDELIGLLEINPNVTIELSAHTDRKGSQDYNQNLSQRRAQSVVDYLITHGISKDRLTVAGYGKLQPKKVTKGIAKKYTFLKVGDVLDEDFINKLEPEQQDIADQINRRTEFKVLSTTYGLQ